MTLTTGRDPLSAGRGETWQPAFTLKEAARLGVSRGAYRACLLWARSVVESHQRRGTARHLWEGSPTQNEQFVAPYIDEGEAVLAKRLARDVDPVVDSMQDGLLRTREGLDELAGDHVRFTTPESGTSYSTVQAVEVVQASNAKIEADEAVGHHHHRRASQVLKLLGRLAPWLEAAGFLAFVTYFLNVPLLQPWIDWLGWTFAVTVVVFVILGQTWLVRHAATSHNIAREARAEGNRVAAEDASRRRTIYLVAVGVVALAITGGMVERGTVALGNAGLGTTVVMVFLAITTGLVMPALAFLGDALDGSKVSRERDALAEDLDADLADDTETIRVAHADLADVADTRDVLYTHTMPDICRDVQRVVDEVYSPYNTARSIIGDLTADPPSPVAATLDADASGGVIGSIRTGIRGARAVDLAPLVDRGQRIGSLDRQRATLLQELKALPPHPWGVKRDR